MKRTSHRRIGALVAIVALPLAGVASVVSATAPPSTEPMGTEPMGTDMMGSEPMGSEPMDDMMGSEPMGDMAGPTGPLCAAVPTDGEGSVTGMADDPVATAASNNPLLSTLVAAVTAAGLADTLNGEGPFTVFAPINSAFDKVDPAALEALLADTDALTQILTYHVLSEQVSSADLVAGGTFATVNGVEMSVAMVNETIVINGGAAAVQCADVQTANATVYLIDSVLTPPDGAETVDTSAPADDTATEPTAAEGAEPTEPAADTTEAAAPTTEGASEPTEPASEPSEPASEPTEPATETTAAS